MMKRRFLVFSILLGWLLHIPPSQGQTAVPESKSKTRGTVATTNSPWAAFVEPDFPFFSSVLDARQLGAGWPTNNLTPRGLILNLGNDVWACFDVDLLRVSAIWNGKGVTPVGMAQGSYHVPGAKAPEGQKKLPQIAGKPWLANGLYPGWQAGDRISLVDPRPPGKDPKEVGRGPIPADQGQFRAIHLRGKQARLEYEVQGALITEQIAARLNEGALEVQRTFAVAARDEALILLLGNRPGDVEPLHISLSSVQTTGKSSPRLAQMDGVWIVRVEPASETIRFSVAMSLTKEVKPWVQENSNVQQRWPQEVLTSGQLSTRDDAFVVDNIPIPVVNPWKRNVRFADIAFRPNGEAAAVTFDGDVWLISGLKGNLEHVRWRRFTSGLHEPLGITTREDEFFVFDRNGIWKLRDTDGNGEADAHELFSNAFTQTAETREYANGIRVAPDGSFVIAKGGQQGTTLGKHNGTVLRISKDGSTATVLGWGLRQPFIGVDSQTGLVTASDQQGHYTPATPLHIVQGGQYYGFLSGLEPKEQYPAPIADPLTWIPHSINASGAGQVWLRGAEMGPLNDRLIHIGYYRPELFVVLLNERTSREQAAVVSLTRDFSFPPFAGTVNPIDGNLYVAGFQIWGTQAEQISGVARFRYTGKPDLLPRELVAMKEGVLLRFEQPLDPFSATNPLNFAAEIWSYKRTAEYGSPHYKADGTKGQDTLFPSSAYLSRDRKAVFVGIAGMQRVMQMRFGWSLQTEQGVAFQQNAYFTPYELPTFDPAREGFEMVEVDLSRKVVQTTEQALPVTVEEGRRVAELVGCVACHSIDGTVLGKVGPSWKGLFGSQRALAGGPKIVADESYLRESILNPAAKVVAGFDKADTGMPSYEGVITPAQLDSLILYIKSLR